MSYDPATFSSCDLEGVQHKAAWIWEKEESMWGWRHVDRQQMRYLSTDNKANPVHPGSVQQLKGSTQGLFTVGAI